MLRLLFAVFITLHGLIHLMGFLKAWGLASFDQLSQDISRPRGLLWLLAAILLIATAISFLFKQNWWWLPALAAISLSQVLVFMYWQDAKAGTIPNMLLLLVALAGFGSWNFERLAHAELGTFRPAEVAVAQQRSPQAIESLPQPVQRWLHFAGVQEGQVADNIYLRQKGIMRTVPNGKWMNYTAQQWFTTGQPGFLWLAKVGEGSALPLSGMDRLLAGKGHMLIKAFGLLPVVNSTGPNIDQSTLLRYLAEIIWFPSAALQPYIQWEAIDELHARATLQWQELSVSGVFTFDESGRVTAFEAQRYYDRKEGATLETWHIDMDCRSYAQFAGLQIPTHSVVSWKLDSGDFVWLKLDILELTVRGH